MFACLRVCVFVCLVGMVALLEFVLPKRMICVGKQLLHILISHCCKKKLNARLAVKVVDVGDSEV